MGQAKNIHMLAKPIGPVCNLNCEYCFYTEKKVLYPEQELFAMSDQVLEIFIEKYIGSQSAPEIPFVWQGGEPTLLGVEFFRRAVALQEKYAGGKKIVNSLQTNGTLLNDEWAEFLKEHDFFVGLSLDGSAEFHDRYRLTGSGEGSFETVMQGLKLLQKYQVAYNVLCCVTKETAYKPSRVYRFFKKAGVEFIQFTPVVERRPDELATKIGLRHATPASLNQDAAVTDWTVEPEVYGDFLIGVFDEWVRHDVGKVHVMNFEWALTAWLGLAATVCVFADECGGSMVVEHDGAVYSCDHYVYPEYQLGSILTATPLSMSASDQQGHFGRNKSNSLPGYCQTCEVKFACYGECPKHRFGTTPDGEPGLNYLCAGYKKFFRHIHPYMKVMRQLIENDLPAAKVMEVIKGPLVIKKR